MALKLSSEVQNNQGYQHCRNWALSANISKAKNDVSPLWIKMIIYINKLTISSCRTCRLLTRTVNPYLVQTSKQDKPNERQNICESVGFSCLSLLWSPCVSCKLRHCPHTLCQELYFVIQCHKVNTQVNMWSGVWVTKLQ